MKKAKTSGKRADGRDLSVAKRPMAISQALIAIAAGFALFLAIVPPAAAQSAQDLVAEGNEAYRNEKYDEALQAYEKAAEIEPNSPHIWFNKGNALYQQGEFAKAMDAFEQAAVQSEEPRLEARSKFNQGNAAFREGIERRQADPRQALAGVGKGVQLYQDALKLDSNLDDARHNVEVARRAIQALLEELKNQPQRSGGDPNSQQDPSQQDPSEQDPSQQEPSQQEAAEKLEELMEQQQQLADQSESLAEQQQQQGDSSELEQKAGDAADQQQQLRQETEQLTEQMPAQAGQQQQASEQAQKHLEQAAAKQEQAERELENQQPAEARDSQQKAREEMQEALQALGGTPSNQGPEQEEASQTPSDQNSAPDPQEQERKAQAQQTAEDILDEERTNRRQRQLRMAGGVRPVEKDW